MMADLFETQIDSFGNDTKGKPLADRLRPCSLREVAGQEHLTADGIDVHQVRCLGGRAVTKLVTIHHVSPERR